VPEVQDEAVPLPATAQQRARKSHALAASPDAVPLATPPIKADRSIEASTVTTLVPQPHGAPAKASHREVEPLTTAAHAIAPPARAAAQSDAAIASTLQAQRPQQFRETHSVAALSTNQSAAQEHPLTTSQSQQPPTPHAATLLSESKLQPSSAAVRTAESKSSPAPSSTRKASTDPAPNASAAQPQLSFKPQAKPAQAASQLLPLTSRVKPATETKPQERPAARVHIGKLEIRMTAPPQPIASPAAAKPAQMQHLTPPAAATAPQPLSRELAWTYGLVQG
jgi:hypothetical protein